VGDRVAKVAAPTIVGQNGQPLVLLLLGGGRKIVGGVFPILQGDNLEEVLRDNVRVAGSLER